MFGLKFKKTVLTIIYICKNHQKINIFIYTHKKVNIQCMTKQVLLAEK